MTRTSAPPRSSDTDNEKNELFAEKVMITTADLYRAGWATSLGSALEYYDFALSSVQTTPIAASVSALEPSAFGRSGGRVSPVSM